MKLIRKQKKADNVEDDLLDGLLTLHDLDTTESLLEELNPRELREMEHHIKDAVKNAPKVLKMIKQFLEDY